MSQYPSLFESIKPVLQELNVHIMLFDPLDGCYHWFAGENVKIKNTTEIKEAQENTEIKKAQEKLKENKKLSESIYNWINQNIGEENKRKSFNEYEQILSALPSKDSWDINGLYHKIFFKEKIPNKVEQHLQQFKQKPILFSYCKKNNQEMLTCKYINNNDVSTIFENLKYEEILEKSDKLYEYLHDTLRSNLFELKVEKIIVMPLVISGFFYGIAFKQIKEDNFKNEERTFSETILRHIQPAVARLIQNELDKRFLKEIDNFRNFEDIIKSFCININLIARCDYCVCTISHPIGEQKTFHFAWRKDENLWTKKFVEVEKSKNNSKPIIIEHQIENSWNIKIQLYTTAELEKVNEIEIKQLIKQKIIALIDPTFEKLKKSRNLVCLQIINRNLSHRLNKVLDPYAIPEKNNLNNLEKEKEYFPAFFKYLKGLFNTNAYIAFPGYNIMTIKQFASDVMKFFWPKEKTHTNYQKILIQELLLKDQNYNFEIIIKKNNEDITEDNDLSVWFPNDLIGIHCLYMILENIIANIKKHMNNGISLKIEFQNYKDTFYKVKISHINENGPVKITKQNFKLIKRYINEPVLSIKGKPRESGWGILEMKISACYLRNIPFEDIDEPNNPPILDTENDNNNGFSYILYLLKPKIASVYNYNGDLPDWLEKINTDTETKAKFLIKISDQNQAGIQNGQLYLTVNENDFKKLLSKIKDPYEFEYQLWLKWLDTNLPNNSKIYNYEVIKLASNQSYSYTLESTSNYHLTSNHHLIVFDNHGENKSKYGNAFYYEPYPTLSGTSDYLKRLNKDNEKNLAICEIVFSATREICIIDERIFALTKEEEKQKLEKMKIYLKSELPENSAENYHYVLVHLQLIEQKVGSRTEDIKKWIESQKSNAKNTQFIIISDRGSPPNIPEDELFLPFDPIYYTLFYLQSKIHLCNLLISARKIKPGGK